jgi:hypothetical protein
MLSSATDDIFANIIRRTAAIKPCKNGIKPFCLTKIINTGKHIR